MEMASSHTSSNQTFSMVHPPPRQYTPSPWFLPMMTFLRVAPFLRINTVSAWPEKEVTLSEFPVQRVTGGNIRTSFLLVLAGVSLSIVAFVSAVEALARGDLDGGRVADCRRGRGHVALGHTGQSRGNAERGEDDDVEGDHFDSSNSL